MRWYGPAEMARRLGVSAKALRVYERAGLVVPDRTAANYRVYGPAHAERLHQVLALKRLGLPLARVGALLSGRLASLDAVLAVQEAVLRDQLAATRAALASVAAARARIAAGDPLSPDDLATLTRETIMTTDRDQALQDALRPAMERNFSDEDRRRLAETTPPFDQAEVSREWDALFAEAKALQAAGDPTSPQAQDLARRWFAQVARFTGGDPAMFAKVKAVWTDSMADPETAGRLPMDPALMAFVSEAKRHADAAG